MKLKFDLEKNNATIDVDAERLIEKGMEQHEKSWKDRLLFKHVAKKEMVKLKHKNKIEVEDKKQKRQTRYQIKQEENRKNKELEFKQTMIAVGSLIGVCLFFILLVILMGN